MKEDLLIECQCKGEVLGVTRFDDETEVYLTVYKYNFSGSNLFSRLKMAIKVLKGEGIATADVVLSEENFNKIKEF